MRHTHGFTWMAAAALALGTGALFGSACERFPDRDRRAGDGGATTERRTEERREGQDEQRQAFKSSVEKRLDAVDKNLETLEDRAQEVDGGARTEIEQLVNDLRARRENISARMNEVDTASVEQFESLKGEIDKQVADLEKEVDRALAREPA